jgi:hypothetical protein
LERAGLADIQVLPYTVAHDYASPDEWIDFVLALNLPLRQLLAGVPDERVRQARCAATNAAAAYLGGDGHIRFPGHGYYAAATRPVR